MGRVVTHLSLGPGTAKSLFNSKMKVEITKRWLYLRGRSSYVYQSECHLSSGGKNITIKNEQPGFQYYEISTLTMPQR